jgi:hypothetical protein
MRLARRQHASSADPDAPAPDGETLQVSTCEWIPLTTTVALVRIVGTHRAGEPPAEPIGLSVADGEERHDYGLVASGGRTLPPRPNTTDLVWMGGFSVPTALVATSAAWSLRVGDAVIELSPPQEGETGAQLAAERDAERRRASESERHLWAARNELLEGRAALEEAQLAAAEPQSGPAAAPAEPEAPRSREVVESELADLTSALAAERARFARLERQLTIVKGDLQVEREARREASARIARLGALALKAAQQRREGAEGVEDEVEELVGSDGLDEGSPPVVEPEPEPVAEVVEPEPEPEPEPVAEVVEPEPEPEPVAEVVEPEPEPEPVAEVVEPEPELEPEPVAEVVEPEPELEPEPVAEVVEPEPEPVAEVVDVTAGSHDAAARRPSARGRQEGSWLGRALIALAEREPRVASQLMLQLLPAQGLAVPAPVTYAVTLLELGAYWVTRDEGPASVVEQEGAARPATVDFELAGGAAAFAQLFAGASPRRLVLTGDLRMRGKTRPMRAVWGRPIDLAEAAQAGIWLDPELVYKAIAAVIDPEWTRGWSFAVAHEVTGERGGTWYVVVDDGKPVEVTREPPPDDPTATVHTTTAGLAGALAGHPVNGGPPTTFGGDLEVVRQLRTWTQWAQSGMPEEIHRRSAKGPRGRGRRSMPSTTVEH